MKNELIPPTLNFKDPNPYIDFLDSPLYVHTDLKQWPRGHRPRRAGISAFGFSGTNCHMVLEEAPGTTERGGSSGLKKEVLTLSAKNERVLESLIKRYCEFSNKNRDLELGDICFSANTGRGHYCCRLAMIVENPGDFREKIQRIGKEGFTNINEHWFFYAAHQVVSDTKSDRVRGEITGGERRWLGSEAEARIRAWRETGGDPADLMEELCKVYILGADINWETLYLGLGRKRVSLPVYPFEKTRYWAGPRFIPESFVHGVPAIQGRNLSQGASDSFLVEDANVRIIGRREGGYTPTERSLAAIWALELGLGQIDIHEDFYHMGGDSLLAIRIANRVQQKLLKRINMSDLFEHLNIYKLAAYLDSQKEADRSGPE
ncbi:MAG: phosphopantetheine-binding protein, partial [Treponemataceae bacterium]|nr:phosphopantetheine-binding protein [Treponemataceae bacterium]